LPKSKKIWGWFVLLLGLLWTLGGITGLLQRHNVWLMLALGLALTRLGYNLSHPGQE